MEKIPTLFLRDLENMRLVTRNVNPDAAWVFDSNAIATVKKDGTNIRVTVVNGQCTHVEKRRNPTREEKKLGAEPGYIDAHREDPSDKHIFAAVDATSFRDWPDGAWSCEALGPKIQGGIESVTPCLYAFLLNPVIAPGFPDGDLTYDKIKSYLESHEIEGIVWHHPDGRMCKVKRRDFNLPWPSQSMTTETARPSIGISNTTLQRELGYNPE